MPDAIDLGTISASVELKLGGLQSGVGKAQSLVSGLAGSVEQQAGRINKSLDASGAKVQSFGAKLETLASSTAGQRIGSSMTLAGAGVAAGFGLAIKAASDFDATINRVANNTTMKAGEIDVMRTTILQMSKESGAALDDLADGWMHVSNFGFTAAQNMVILREAMKSAVSTGGKVGATADILAKSMHEFGLKTTDAGHAMNVMHLAAAEGNMTLEQFDSVAGPAFSAAAALGAGFTETAAAISALTRHGYDAAEAVTQVKDVFAHLMQGSKQTKDELAKLSAATGINLTQDFTAAGLKARGLYGVFLDLATATKGHADEVYKLIPAMRGGQGAMVLASTGAEDYRKILLDLNDGMSGKLDPSTQDYNRTLGTTENKSQRARAEFQQLQIKIGNDLIPAFNDAATAAGKLLDKFNAMPDGKRKAVESFVAIAGAIALVTGGLMSALKFAAELKIALAGAGWLGGGGLLGSAGAAGLLGRLGLMSGGLGYGGVAGTAGLGGNLIGGTVLALPAIVAGYGAYKIAGQQNEVYNQEQRGNGTNTDDLALRTDRIAKLRTEMAGLTAGTAEYKKVQHELAQEKAALSQMSGADRRGAVGVAPTSDAGMKIAREAYAKYQSGLSASYVHMCEGLAHDNYKAVSGAYEKILSSGGPGNSAKKTLGRFQAAGLAHPYTPGMALPPGSLLYSNSMGKGSGHVQTIGPNGQRLDQYGVNHFAESNFQFYVPPPGAKVNGLSNSGLPGVNRMHGKPPLTDAQKEKLADQAGLLQDQRDQLYEASHGQFANRRYEAKQDRDKADADPAATRASKAVAQQAYLAKIKEINADERKEQKSHYDDLLRQWKEHLRQKAEAQKAALAAQQAIGTEAARRKGNLLGLSADMTDNTAALTEDPDTYQFGKDRAEAAKRLRDRQDAIGKNQTLGPYGKNDVDPGTLLKQAQAEYNAAMKHIQADEDAKNARDAQEVADKATREKDKADRAIEEADRAAEKQKQDIEETARFEYEQGMISLSQYQAFLKAKLAATQQWADASHTILSKDWMIAKADLDASQGDKKQKPGNDPAGFLGDGMKTGAGKLLEDTFDGGKGKLHSMSAEVKNWEDETIKAIKHVAAMWAMSSLFGSKFGGGFNFGGGGKDKSGAGSTAGAVLPALTAWGGSVPSTKLNLGGSGKSLTGNLLGALPQIGQLAGLHGINGPVGGKTSGLDGAMDIAGLAASFLPGGSLLAKLFGGKGGGILGGLGKIFHFATGGIVPGTGHGDSVPAMLTPGERVLTKAQQRGMGGGSPINITHNGDVHGVEGVAQMHADWAWGVSQQLNTAVAGT